MTRAEMWGKFVTAREWGLKEEFKKLTDEEIEGMTEDECILKCYMMLLNIKE